jgi:hypothetical protein
VFARRAAKTVGMPEARRKRRAVRKPTGRMRVAHRSAGRPIRRGIRWDRLPGNWLIVIVLLMAVLYVPPLHSYYKQRKQTSAEKAQLQSLGKENRALRSRAKALRRDSTIELEARKLGMVKNGERPYVILR